MNKVFNSLCYIREKILIFFKSKIEVSPKEEKIEIFMEEWTPVLDYEQVYDLLKKGEISKYDWEKFEVYFERYQRGFLCRAAIFSDLNVIKFLVGVGVDIDMKNSKGYTCLMVATANNYYDMVKFLVESGANIEVKNHLDWTALRLAAIYGCPTIENYLKQKLNE